MSTRSTAVPLRASRPLLPGTLLALATIGCSVNELPTTGAPRNAVLDATREAIAEQYSDMNIASADLGYVLALSPPAIEGATTTKRQISVRLVQNYTGAYEPIVRVRHYFDIATPSMEGDPAAHPISASPFADHEWKPMGFLPHEEEALRAAIREKLAAMGL